jgi:taurine dioxygenase
MITFKPVTGALAADVYGVDLAQPLSEENLEVIRYGLAEHQVLFFREQRLMTVEQHMALAEHFGEPEPASFRLPDSKDPPGVLMIDQADSKGSESARFHADNTYRSEPPICVILQAHVLPARGGDTCFASMTAAYEALSPAMQVFLEGLEAYHSYARMMERLTRRTGLKPGVNPDQFPPVKHPVIARHPVTGRKLLFVNYNWTTHIDGLTDDESAAILDFLYEHVKNPDFQARMRWNKGDVVMWDNRAVQHHAAADYHERRVMRRIALLPKAVAEKPKARAAQEAATAH